VKDSDLVLDASLKCKGLAINACINGTVIWSEIGLLRLNLVSNQTLISHFGLSGKFCLSMPFGFCFTRLAHNVPVALFMYQIYSSVVGK